MKIIAFVQDAYGGFGGIAQYNRDLMAALSSCNGVKEVHVIQALAPQQVDPPSPDKVQLNNAQSSSKFIYVCKSLISALKHRGVDLIICGHINLLPLAITAKLLTGAPILLETYGIEVWRKSSVLKKLLLKMYVDYFTYISHITKERFLNWACIDKCKSYYLPNGIDLRKYSPGENDEEICDRYNLHGKKSIITVGRLSAQERYKGFDEVLNILKQLISEVGDVIYFIVGEGTDKSRLQNKVAQLGLGNCVVFTGKISDTEKIKLLRAADAYVMPSYGEGFGFVILESLACGTPVVASKIDGSREAVLNGKIGTLVDPHNPQEIISGIIETLRQNKSHEEIAPTFYSIDNFQVRVEAMIKDVAQNGQ